MLTSIVLKLLAPEDATLPAHLGRANYAEVLQRLELASPTTFKSKGKQMPLPLPGLVFGSLVDRWNRFSPVTLDPAMRTFGEELVAVSRFDLRSVLVQQKNQAGRVGAMGQVAYVAEPYNRYWLSVFQMLADFALYSGVGVQTATGMGQVRRV